MRKTNRFGLVTMFLLLALGSAPAWGAGSEPICTADGCAVPTRDQTDKCIPAYNDVRALYRRHQQPGSSLAACEGRPAWARHAKFFDQNWKGLPGGDWRPCGSGPPGSSAAAQTATVFYPFSGPDFINVFALYPRAKTYLLIALEPVGKMPDFSSRN